MDNFVTIHKSSSSVPTRKADGNSQKSRSLHAPYDPKKKGIRKPNNWRDKQMTERLVAPLLKDNAKPSSSAITKHLLETLTDESNPITHSDIYNRTDYVTSAASGHQRSDGRVDSEHLRGRAAQLTEQYQGSKSSERDLELAVLRNVKVYIDGYLANTTDIEMKRIVTLAGGQVLQSASGATHILTSQQLSGSKTHKLLTTKSKIKAQVVRPEWVYECIKNGKRLPERNYSVVKKSSTIDAYLSESSAKKSV